MFVLCIELFCGIVRKLIGVKYFLKGYEVYVGFVNIIFDYRLFCDIDGYGIYIVFILVGNFV